MRIALLALLGGCQLVFSVDVPDREAICAGNGPNALLDTCVSPERADLGVVQVIDTGDRADPTDLGDCDSIVEQQAGSEVCVISALTIQIGNTIVIGARPLLLVSASDLVVTGTLSAASHLAAPAGPGASFACPGDLAGVNSTGFEGGGGGAGGSFAAEAGDGGAGNPDAPGGNTSFDTTPISFVRGGCAGGSGGDRLDGARGGLGGDSGGAIYLVAKSSITIVGTLDASGSGGQGGAGANNDGCGGGGGGGSGGLIALDAPSIVLAVTAKLVANGGGGGAGGGSNNTDGPDGANADTSSVFPFGAGGGFTGSAGDGGNGANALDLGAGPGSSDGGTGAGGGGGGGSTGIILLVGAVEDQNAAISPPPQVD
jgi:hypothetical protein